MSPFIPIILISGFISFIMTPVVLRLARTMNFVDAPQERKMHSEPTPMLGGISIYLGIAMVLLYVGITSEREMLGLLAGATLITGVGLWDDRRDMSPAIKMLGQVAAAAILILSGVQINLFAFEPLNISLTIFWVVGICNAINFLDNMDGLAGGLAMIASAFIFILSAAEGIGPIAVLAAATAGACVGFLYYNFNPAILFMGDSGSLLLGYVLAAMGIQLTFIGRPLQVTWMVPLVILGLPLFDMSLVVFSRIRRGVPVWEGGKDHSSHRLMQIAEMPPSRAVMTLYLAAGVLGMLGVMLVDATLPQAMLILVGLAVAYIAAFAWMEINFKPATTPVQAPSADQ